jgi:hypothetical protein
LQYCSILLYLAPSKVLASRIGQPSSYCLFSKKQKKKGREFTMTSGAPEIKHSIEASAAHFATHSSLTLNSSKLSDVLQLLVNGYNSHETQISELQAQVKGLQLQLSEALAPAQPVTGPSAVGAAITATTVGPIVSHQSASVLPTAALAPPPPPPPPPTVVITEPQSTASEKSSLPSHPQPITPVIATAKRDFSSPSRTSSPAAKTAAGGRAAPSTELEKVKQSIAQLQQMIGLHTDLGKEAMRQFMFAVGTSANIQEPPTSAFKALLQLPLFSVIVQQIAEDAAPDTYLRGFEAKLDLLTTTVEAIAQQQQQALVSGAGGAGGASRKSTTNTSQRSPLVSTALATLSSSSGSATSGAGGASVDAAARVDIARFAKEIKVIQNDLLSLKTATTELADRKRKQSSALSAASEASESDEETPAAKAADAAQMAKVIKRVDALERIVRRGSNASANSTPAGAGSSLLSPNGAVHPPTKFSLGGSAPNEKTTTKKPVGGSQLADSANTPAPAPAIDYTAVIHAVEEKAMIANRKLKDSLVASLGSQIDALKRDVARHDDWIAAHDLVHDELVPTLISRASFVVAGSGGLGGDSRSQSPKRPASAMLNNVHSPFVPKRDAIIRAGAQNPRNHSSTRVVVDPYNSASAATAAASSLAQQQRPNSAMSARSNKSSVTYKLYQHQHSQSNVGFSGSSPFPTTSPHEAATVAPPSRTPQASNGLLLFSSPAGSAVPAGHNADSCVVWECGWCTASRDRMPQWSGCPTPPHR